MITVSFDGFFWDSGLWICIGVFGDDGFRCIGYSSIFATVSS